MATLLELLAQADLPSEMEFKNDQGQIIRLADLRNLNGTIDAEKRRLQDETNKSIEVAKEAQGLAAALKKALDEQAAAAAPPAKKDDKQPAWRANPLYEELLPVIDALEATTKQATAQAATSKAMLDRMSAFYSIERMRNEYNSAPESYRKANEFNKAVAEALANKEVFTFGEGENAISMPTLSRRIHSATEPDRIASAVAEALAKNNKDWEAKSRIAAGSGKPGGATRFSTKKAGEPPIKKLEDLTSEAVAAEVAKDPEFAKALEGEPV